MSEMMGYPIDPTSIIEGRRETSALSDEQQQEAESPTEIEIGCGLTRARIAPEKGAIVTSLSYNGQEVFFVDQEAFADPGNKKPRTGVPNLIPYGGNKPIAPGMQSGKEDALQHGGSREVPCVWQEQTESSTRVSLDSHTLPEGMRGKLKKVYDESFEYKADMLVSVGDGSFRYDMAITNNGEQVADIAPNLHPYFPIDHARRGEITSSLPGFDASEVGGNSKRFKIPEGVTEASFNFPDGKTITIKVSSQYKYFVAWAEKEDSDYVCIEPFVADPKNLEEYVKLQPGSREELSVEFSIKNPEPLIKREFEHTGGFGGGER